MIIVRLKGGLGNQLFQYAAARALALQHGCTLMLDHSDFFVNEANKTPRRFALHDFHLGRGVIGKRPQGRTTTKMTSLFCKALQRAGAILFCEPNLDFQPQLAGLRDNVIMDGYFQSHHYFCGIRNVLLQEFICKASLPDSNRRFLAAIESGNSVSLHVRRGDYVKNAATAGFHGVSPLEYYRRAVALLQQQHEHLNFFIFSDDLPWCRSEFSFLEQKEFVDCNSTETAHFDLFLMSRCRYHIIANSSFSWWGAWISDFRKGSVIYPQQWFLGEKVNIESRFPAEWVGV
jgi:hypothetical protein